jgi:taurine dioxygenase
VDPGTGRKSLYVNRGYTRSIVGMKTDEARALLDFLFLQAHTPEYQVRVSWRPGDLVAWDNQRTQHYLVQDRKFHRVMHRVMVLRGEPVHTEVSERQSKVA